MKNKRYIITGGPGSGKSTLIEYLKKKKYKCYEETSRIIIKEQNAIQGTLTPWQDVKNFAEACYVRMKLELNNKEEEIVFYDRGLPDIIAYLYIGGIKIPEKYFSEHKNYNNTIFICPPWQYIYINDDERPESFSDSQKMYEEIKKVYTSLGCKLIELPLLSVNERVKYIEEQISTSANF